MDCSRNSAAKAPIRTLRSGLLCLFLLVSAAGCASSGSKNPFAEGSSVEWYNLRVENRNLYEVSVYVVPRGQRRVLVGAVSPGRYDFLEFQYPVGLPLAVELENEIGDRYRIPSVPFIGGGRVELVVLDNLRRSGYIRRQ